MKDKPVTLDELTEELYSRGYEDGLKDKQMTNVKHWESAINTLKLEEVTAAREHELLALLFYATDTPYHEFISKYVADRLKSLKGME